MDYRATLVKQKLYYHFALRLPNFHCFWIWYPVLMLLFKTSVNVTCTLIAWSCSDPKHRLIFGVVFSRAAYFKRINCIFSIKHKIKKENCPFLLIIDFIPWTPKCIFSLVTSSLVKILIIVITRWNETR